MNDAETRPEAKPKLATYELELIDVISERLRVRYKSYKYFEPEDLETRNLLMMISKLTGRPYNGPIRRSNR